MLDFELKCGGFLLVWLHDVKSVEVDSSGFGVVTLRDGSAFSVKASKEKTVDSAERILRLQS